MLYSRLLYFVCFWVGFFSTLIWIRIQVQMSQVWSHPGVRRRLGERSAGWLLLSRLLSLNIVLASRDNIWLQELLPIHKIRPLRCLRRPLPCRLLIQFPLWARVVFLGQKRLCHHMLGCPVADVRLAILLVTLLVLWILPLTEFVGLKHPVPWCWYLEVAAVNLLDEITFLGAELH